MCMCVYIYTFICNVLFNTNFTLNNKTVVFASDSSWVTGKAIREDKYDYAPEDSKYQGKADRFCQ